VVDRLLDKEIVKFEEYYSQKQREAGFDGAPLATFERSVLKGYLYFASTERRDDDVDG